MKQDMLHGSPGKSLFLFALPMIIGNLFQQFYNMADTVIVGKFVGEDALAAVGASYSLTTVFIMIAIGGGIGASVLTSQYLGAGDYGKMKTSIHTALMSFLCLSILLAVFGLIVNPSILRLLKTPDNIMDDALLYLQIYFLGMPFLFMYNVLASTFNALGESKIPLYLLVFSSILNIFLDLFMIRNLHMGVAGAAIATVMAQGVSAVISFAILRKRLKAYEARKGAVKLFDPSMLWTGTQIAVPSIIQQSIVSIGMLLVQSVVNGFGSSVLAGYSAGMRVESICIVPMIATGNAMSTFTAQNLGAKQADRVKKGYVSAYGLIISFAVIIWLILKLFHNEIISAFMDTDAAAAAFGTGNAYLTFICWFFVLIGFKAITDGVLRGAGDVGVYMAANLVNLGIRVFVANHFAAAWGVAAVWYAVPMGWGMNYLISFAWFLTGRWSRKRLIKEV
ncbi:MATE family efflux transporter [Clostridium sp. AM58-1XD]|uniref:MATE family efflux transporter n=1 Tax=Clostridium sp. AM58-1XD TaxID=2292307 RepID=UPI000E536628|nr:MATE family efflux transporter [Clostridium sp. AM58-1XD]RGZ01496.1 MATE family efflux transporter [Clostridium sp. AM58-1XD]